MGNQTPLHVRLPAGRRASRGGCVAKVFGFNLLPYSLRSIPVVGGRSPARPREVAPGGCGEPSAGPDSGKGGSSTGEGPAEKRELRLPDRVRGRGVWETRRQCTCDSPARGGRAGTDVWQRSLDSIYCRIPCAASRLQGAVPLPGPGGGARWAQQAFRAPGFGTSGMRRPPVEGHSRILAEASGIQRSGCSISTPANVSEFAGASSRTRTGC
jgi:hypothetical protein